MIRQSHNYEVELDCSFFEPKVYTPVDRSHTI